MLLLATCALAGNGCLIAEAPDYGAPRRTTPVIDRLNINPSPSFLVEVSPQNPTVKFTMKVRSEDAGEQLLASHVIDYGMLPPRQLAFGPTQVPARAADEPKTLIFDFKWDIRISKGCRSLTVLVMHESSYDLSRDLPIEGAPSDDIAAVTWWMDVKTNETGDALPCPTSPEAQ